MAAWTSPTLGGGPAGAVVGGVAGDDGGGVLPRGGGEGVDGPGAAVVGGRAVVVGDALPFSALRGHTSAPRKRTVSTETAAIQPQGGRRPPPGVPSGPTGAPAPSGRSSTWARPGGQGTGDDTTSGGRSPGAVGQVSGTPAPGQGRKGTRQR